MFSSLNHCYLTISLLTLFTFKKNKNKWHHKPVLFFHQTDTEFAGIKTGNGVRVIPLQWHCLLALLQFGPAIDSGILFPGCLPICWSRPSALITIRNKWREISVTTVPKYAKDWQLYWNANLTMQRECFHFFWVTFYQISNVYWLYTHYNILSCW